MTGESLPPEGLPGRGQWTWRAQGVRGDSSTPLPKTKRTLAP